MPNIQIYCPTCEADVWCHDREDGSALSAIHWHDDTFHPLTKPLNQVIAEYHVLYPGESAVWEKSPAQYAAESYAMAAVNLALLKAQRGA